MKPPPLTTDTSTITVISKDVPGVFSCPKESSVDLMSNINYPSISASNLTGFQSRTINRTLTNVAGDGYFNRLSNH